MPGPDPKVDAESILAVFVVRADPAFTAIEIANELDYTRQGVRNRLDALTEQGLLRSKSPGERTRIYWISEEGHQYYYDRSA